MRCRIAEPADADDERMRLAEFFLRVRTELRQQDMAAVAKKLRIIHFESPARKAPAKQQRPARRAGVLSDRSRSGVCRRWLRLRGLRLAGLRLRDDRGVRELLRRLLELLILVW